MFLEVSVPGVHVILPNVYTFLKGWKASHRWTFTGTWRRSCGCDSVRLVISTPDTPTPVVRETVCERQYDAVVACLYDLEVVINRSIWVLPARCD